jgi:LPS O-antigen subunit length determinant protein (WzzB/FepE family)
MTAAKQKANELVDKYIQYVEAYSSQGQLENAKICALIAAEEVLNELNTVLLSNPFRQFWQEVKREIQAIR